MNLGPATHNARITRNVIADNCANPLGGVNDCSANIIYWGSTPLHGVQQQHDRLPASPLQPRRLRLQPGHAGLPRVDRLQQPGRAQLLLLDGQRLQRRPAGQRHQLRMGREVRTRRPPDDHGHRSPVPATARHRHTPGATTASRRATPAPHTSRSDPSARRVRPAAGSAPWQPKVCKQAGRSLNAGFLVGRCVLQRPRHAELLQAAQGADLHLADPLAGDAEDLAHLLERHRLVAVQPVAQLDDPPLALGQAGKRLLQVLPHDLARGDLVGLVPVRRPR